MTAVRAALSETVSVHMNRRAFVIVLGALSLFGLIAAAVPFFRSLQPSERAKLSRRALDISGINPGAWGTFDGKHSRLIVVRALEGQLYLHVVPLWDGMVAMPDLHWWRQPMYLCLDFGPDTTPGSATNSTIIRCKDEATPAWWAERWRWTIDGRNVARGSGVESIPTSRFDQIGTKLYVARNL